MSPRWLAFLLPLALIALVAMLLVSRRSAPAALLPPPPPPVVADPRAGVANSTATRREPPPTLPAIPHGSQSARARMWQRVQRTVDVDVARDAIEDHRRRCADNASVRATDFSNASLLDSGFQFVLYNFGDRASEADAGYRRVFIALQTRTAPASRGGYGRDEDDPSLRSNASSLIPAGARVCTGGAAIIGDLQSDLDRIALDFFLEVDGAPGLYEIQPFFRRGGNYRLCLVLQAWSYNFRFRFNKWTFLSRASQWDGDPTTIGVGSNASNNRSAAIARSLRWWQAAHGDRSVWFVWRYRGRPSPRWCIAQRLNHASCFEENVRLSTRSVQRLALALRQQRGGRPCGSNVGDFDAGGAWARVAACDGDVCRGDPAAALPAASRGEDARDVALGGRWVFVHDACTVTLYSKAAELWHIVDKTASVLFWGSSSLKEPALNLVEYLLRVPVAGNRFMEQLPHETGDAALRQFLSYRQFDRLFRVGSVDEDGVFRRRRARLALCWGGCPHVFTPGPSCGSQMGMSTRRCVGRVLWGMQRPGIWTSRVRARMLEGNPSAQPDGDDRNARFGIPRVMILNHWEWRFRKDNETHFVAHLDETINWLSGTVRARQLFLLGNASSSSSSRCVPKPTLVWISPTAQQYGADERDSRFCGTENERALIVHTTWRLRQYFDNLRRRLGLLRRPSPGGVNASRCFARGDSSPFSDVVFLDRLTLTLPLAVGGHYGATVHWGRTRGLCNTRGLLLSNCVRNATADWMLMQQWLGLLDNLT